MSDETQRPEPALVPLVSTDALFANLKILLGTFQTLAPRCGSLAFDTVYELERRFASLSEGTER